MKIAASLSLTLCLLLPCHIAAAQLRPATPGPGERANQPLAAEARLQVMSAQQAVQLVKRQYQGKVLKVKAARVNGHPGYKVKLLSDDGMVFYVAVDAQTGRVMRN
ncbi:PepSY domain-containing protein [Shewanella sp. AS16]|uniref:PepSY domain-containing protein n=1 Tax=Shewanella sp. AS16 TaxID=2907625 RepID=UPI001F32F324|nr:PepSY domain-containing protein [Shewanella sp. AS16]MCE9685252.1 PepSY domain-containing protein [Shewanella sp. AS16]